MFKVIAPCAIRNEDGSLQERLSVGKEYPAKKFPEGEIERLVKAGGIEPVEVMERAITEPPVRRRGRPKRGD